MNPLLLVDFYKTNHTKMYPEGMTLLYSNFTPRKSRIKEIDKVVFFGLQHFIKEYLIESFNKNFFEKNIANVLAEYSRQINVDTTHISKLHELGYLPIEIKALEEGALCPIGVPCFTIKNTHPDFGWLTNYLETLISCMMWQPITSATIAYEYKKLLDKYSIETTGSAEGTQWQGHDFSMRGMSSVESAILSGMGHLLSFTGSDTIPAIYQLEKSYGATGLIGASVPATEHSVECMSCQGTMEGEYQHTKRLLELYPTGIVSKVSDTTDLWSVITIVLPRLKEEILARDGKLVIRPDSGNPVDIICGKKHTWVTTVTTDTTSYYDENNKEISESEAKGVIELLWETFGGTTNEQRYNVLDSHIGAIYGDSITIDRARQICERLKAKGFASSNIVFGIGSYTYQYNTRDTFGFAMKATYGEVNGVGREIFKDPITDDGTKKSKKGLLGVYAKLGEGVKGPDSLVCLDQLGWDQEKGGFLKTVFLNGVLTKLTTLEEIRERLKNA